MVPRVQYAEGDLGDHVLRRDNVDVVHVADLLKFDIPVSQLLGREIHAIPLMSNIPILAEDAAHVAPAHEDGATTIVALDARFWLLLASLPN